MSSNTDPAPPADHRSGRIKEIVAAVIAFVIIGCLLLLLWKSFQYVGGDERASAAFQQIKDLLLFINALVGVVIGYYFTKVSTENRAESAEVTARDATAAVRQALAARDEAEAESRNLRSALADIWPAAEQLLAQIPEPSSSEADSAGMDEQVVEAYLNLQAEVQRAKHTTR
jgi:hypothetical protein